MNVSGLAGDAIGFYDRVEFPTRRVALVAGTATISSVRIERRLARRRRWRRVSLSVDLLLAILSFIGGFLFASRLSIDGQIRK